MRRAFLVWAIFILALLHSRSAQADNCKSTSCPNSICSSLEDGYECSCPTNFTQVAYSPSSSSSSLVDGSFTSDPSFYPCQHSCDSDPSQCDLSLLCPSGWACTNSTVRSGQPVLARLCRPGRYCPSETIGQGLPCIHLTANLSVFCPLGSIAPLTCPSGSYCPTSDTSQPVKCPAGSSCIAGSFQPNYCTPGRVCPSTSSAPIMCSRGRYCPTANMTSSLPCTVGFYCPTSGTVTPLACPLGTFCSSGTHTPSNCTAGRYCSSPSSSLVCPFGNYCPSGSVTPTPCTLAGTSCPQGSSQPQPCTSGYWCPTALLTYPCHGGHYCPSGAKSPLPCPEGTSCLAKSVEPLPCTIGMMCPERSYAPIACPVGSWCTWTTATECDDGVDCAGGVLKQCSPGFFCTAGIAQPCPPGTRCPDSGMIEPIKCSSGTYDDRPQLAANECAGKCSFWFSNSDGATDCTEMSHATLAIVIILPMCALCALLYATWSLRSFSVKSALNKELAAERERTRQLELAQSQFVNAGIGGGAGGGGGVQAAGGVGAGNGDGNVHVHIGEIVVGVVGSDEAIERPHGHSVDERGHRVNDRADNPSMHRHRLNQHTYDSPCEYENENLLQHDFGIPSYHPSRMNGELLFSPILLPPHSIGPNPPSNCSPPLLDSPVTPLDLSSTSPVTLFPRDDESRFLTEMAVARMREVRRYAIETLVERIVADLDGTIEIDIDPSIDSSYAFLAFQAMLTRILLSIFSSTTFFRPVDFLTSAPTTGSEAVPSLHSTLYPAFKRLAPTMFQLYLRAVMPSLSPPSSHTPTADPSSDPDSPLPVSVPISVSPLSLDTVFHTLRRRLIQVLVPESMSWYHTWCPNELVEVHDHIEEAKQNRRHSQAKTESDININDQHCNGNVNEKCTIKDEHSRISTVSALSAPSSSSSSSSFQSNFSFQHDSSSKSHFDPAARPDTRLHRPPHSDRPPVLHHASCTGTSSSDSSSLSNCSPHQCHSALSSTTMNRRLEFHPQSPSSPTPRTRVIIHTVPTRQVSPTIGGTNRFHINDHDQEKAECDNDPMVGLNSPPCMTSYPPIVGSSDEVSSQPDSSLPMLTSLLHSQDRILTTEDDHRRMSRDPVQDV